MKDSTRETIEEIKEGIGCIFVLIVIILIFFRGCSSLFTSSSHKDAGSYYDYEAQQEQYEYMKEEQENYESMAADEEYYKSMYANATNMVENEDEHTVSGTVENIYISTDGGASFIDLNYKYPDERRVSVIIWPENLDNLHVLLNNLNQGEKIYIDGELSTYNGVKQIEVSNPDQITRGGY